MILSLRQVWANSVDLDQTVHSLFAIVSAFFGYIIYGKTVLLKVLDKTAIFWMSKFFGFIR